MRRDASVTRAKAAGSGVSGGAAMASEPVWDAGDASDCPQPKAPNVSPTRMAAARRRTSLPQSPSSEAPRAADRVPNSYEVEAARGAGRSDNSAWELLQGPSRTG